MNSWYVSSFFPSLSFDHGIDTIKILLQTRRPIIVVNIYSMCLQYKFFEESVGKGEIACNKQFLIVQ